VSSFFANIQLRLDDPERVIGAVRVVMRRAGFRPETEQFAGDRSLYVSPADDGWVAVFDSGCDGSTVGPLAWLTQALSAQLACPALAWLVHDRALLYLLFDRGEVADRYLSDPTYFRVDAAPVNAQPLRPLGGDGETLLRVCQAAGDDLLISRWLQRPDPLPQTTLRQVAAMIGQTYADLGHADIEAEALDGSEGLELDDLDAFERLEFVRDDDQAQL
jgi:hypothetical protein